MGQKAHPYVLRLGYIKPWKAKWFGKRDFADLLEEDMKIRKFVKAKLSHAGIADVEIERSSGRVRVRIFTARPGIIIGRRGQEIDKVKDDLSALTGKEIFVDIKEVKNPQINAQLVAENIAMQLIKRIGFRRAMKKAVQTAMQKGALGIKVKCRGRLGGSEIARHEGYHEGKVPLSTFRADVNYGFAEAHTTYGVIGCKVWIYKGDILVKKQEAEARLEREKKQAELEKSLASKVSDRKSDRDEENSAVVTKIQQDVENAEQSKVSKKPAESKENNDQEK